MFRWAPYAMVRVTACLVAGVITGISEPGFPKYSLEIVSYCALAAFSLAFCLKYKALAGIAGLLLVGLFGYCLVFERTPSVSKDHVVNCSEEVVAYKITVSSFTEQRARSARTMGDITAIKTTSGWRPASGSMLIYVPLKDSIEYHYGDVLLVNGQPKRITAPTNPGSFDFRKYMEYKGVYFQDVIIKGRVTFVVSDPNSKLLYYAILVRGWADDKIKSVVAGAREQATASALVLGVTDGLDSDLLRAYASTGALHVLAVSGLHVSILYWIILLVLKPLDKKRSTKWILAIISVLLLWAYAFVSGWSPSVLRAVTMFSFVAFARPWRQSTNIFNTLASSMFCLLLYDPYYIMSVGFQLSYLAVFGIVLLQPKLYSLWEPQSRIADEIWKVSSVSIAAQIATLPIGLLYFHQFPSYFLPANLAVIPISFVVLVLGVAIGIFAFIDPLIQILGWLMTWTVKLMNGIVMLFESLPYSVIDNIYLTPAQALILGALITAFVMLFMQRHFYWILVCLVLAVGLSVTQWNRYLDINRQASVRIYDVKGHSIIDHLTNQSSVRFMDTLASVSGVINTYIKPGWLRDGIRYTSLVRGRNAENVSGCKVWLWNGLSMLQVTSKHHRIPKGSVALVVISNNSLPTLAELGGVKCEKIIVDSSNSLYFAEHLRKEAIALGRPLWSVPHDGAFEYKHALH